MDTQTHRNRIYFYQVICNVSLSRKCYTHHGGINKFGVLTGMHSTALYQACLDTFECSFDSCSYLATRKSLNMDEVFFIYLFYVEPACNLLVLSCLVKMLKQYQVLLKA